MKSQFYNFSIIALILFLVSCSKESTSSSSQSSSTTTTQSTASASLTILDMNGNPKQSYKVMMFKDSVTTTSALPPIQKEVTSGADGVAYFDLSNTVTGSVGVKYYFEAFLTSAGGYTLESINHPSLTVRKGEKASTSIMVH